MRINIITNWRDRKGLWRDGYLLRDNLKAWGHSISEIQFNDRQETPLAGLNIFLETLRPDIFSRAEKNWWVPNPEWVEPSDLVLVSHLDGILCKTQETLRLLSPYTERLTYTGWESEDRFDPLVKRSLQALHIAGGSILKGTAGVLETWERFVPPLPLIVVGEEQVVKPRRIFNVAYRLGRVSDTELKELQNASLIHLCPSEAEGWGHTIYEGLSTNALVIVGASVTGAFSIQSFMFGRRCLATLRKVDPQALGLLITSIRAAHSPQDLIRKLVGEPRSAFLEMRDSFRATLYKLIIGVEVQMC